MPGNAFVYGTLMADEVVKVLIKRVPTSKPAALKGYTRYKVKGQVFPAIVPSTAESKVEGKVLLDLSDKELEVLDVYESEEYYRATVMPVLEDGSEIKADVYVWKDQYRQLLLAEDWSFEQFMREHHERYLDMTRKFAEEELQN
ncbi:hypothetical protein VOLCADRAFT_105355 [Volvox carteri f. nagariensis]|uniref:Putative gamma-glutamylcyclotransferase n=1 Tax=Volvox carteri f. nagariensis TaxID=3068 RepID=D8U0B7_VOLCA|nr:uncharacterized protein VOLCADRAFT_105355 [Volvox carteri f. nagariensis]EFJ46914.1 hypothetical protein VOLCADRAFT_105355 [Volvox carteri f. nagariensis]|eukprot:XP_002952123.1 hypothetical protein VOLCADRAFT_105355 [Volvox carteri f. nagariensis]